jgi:hypothetical protein
VAAERTSASGPGHIEPAGRRRREAYDRQINAGFVDNAPGRVRATLRDGEPADADPADADPADADPPTRSRGRRPADAIGPNEEATVDLTSRISELQLHLNHRHSDGRWSGMREHHDAADHDAERSWIKGRRIFRCDCGEEVVVSTEAEPDAPIR